MPTNYQRNFDDNVSLRLHDDVKEDKEAEESDYITVELKCKAGTTSSSAPSYKKRIKIFECGTPKEYVDVRQAIEEIWRQNGVTRATDQVNTVRMLIRGDSFTLFESAITDATAATEENPEGLELTPDMVKKGLEAVASDIFPHRALFFQKRWMEREMKKPRALTTRQTIAALVKINNALPLFPGATEEDKYDEKELLKIMEFLMPREFREKFDEKGYIPADHDKNRLILEAEIVERHQQSQKEKGGKKFKENKGKAKQKGTGDKKAAAKKYCSHHGANKGHNSDECWTLHPELKPTKKPRLSNNAMRKEINLLAKQEKKSPLEIVDLKLEQLKKAKAALTKSKAKKEQLSMEPEEIDSSEDDSKSETSCNQVEVLEKPIPRKKKAYSADEFIKINNKRLEETKQKKGYKPIDFLNKRNEEYVKKMREEEQKKANKLKELKEKLLKQYENKPDESDKEMKKRKRRVITEDDEEEAIIIDDSSDKTKASADDITEEELAYRKLAKEAQDNL